MASAIEKGKLKRWDGGRGFGFIQPEDGGRDVFLHISALRGAGRAPVTGDIIYYYRATDDQGRLRATEAVIEGVARNEPAPDSNPPNRPARTAPNRARASIPSYRARPRHTGLWWLPALLLIAAFVKFMEYPRQELAIATHPAIQATAISAPAAPAFECQGKTRCPEMTSCAEAVFYLRHCPGTQMDGDHDGLPCEDQLCGH